MKTRFILLTSLLLILITGSALAETVAGLPLHIQKLDEGVIRVWVGDYISSTATVAVATRDGLVIIDTTGNPQVDRELRQVIARELGRDDFTTLINTHHHQDHTGGNAVYADCTIVGHELVEAGMQRFLEGLPRVIDWRTNRIAELEHEIGQLEPDAPEAGKLRENLISNRLLLAVAQANDPLVPPTQTFADRLVLDRGDTSFDLYFIGGMHSTSDIAILVPEHGLLLTGDTMADVWLIETPGCLASFIARPGVRHDFPLLLKNWNALLARKDEIKTLLPGHWNGELTFEGFENRVKYVEALWDAANTPAVANANLEAFLADYRLETRFPALVNSPGCSQGNNATTMTEMWAIVTNQESAALAIFELLDNNGDEAAIRNIVDQHRAESPSHFFQENQINNYGYRLLRAEKVAQATTMFRINAELYPESWNAYDSLGEALLASGQTEAAIAMYEKSLELNPESPSGRDMLERIRSEAAVN